MVFSDSTTDEELMQAYQNGIDEAFDLLFKRHSSRVYGFLINRLKDRSKAEDVFQATFLKLHQARRHYDPKFPFAPWLFTVCKSVLMDYQRKSLTIREELNEDIVSRTPADQKPSHLPPMDELNDKEQAAIRMRYGEDLQFSEIAQRMNTSESNVRQIVSRGIKNLKMLLTKKGEPGGRPQ